MLDDDEQIRAQAAAPFEPAQRLVVALDDVQADLGGEIVGLGRGQTMAAAHLIDDRVDDGEVGEEERFVVHERSSGTGSHDAGKAARSADYS